jgi:hypothetical protein
MSSPQHNALPESRYPASVFEGCLPGITFDDAHRLGILTTIVHDAQLLGAPIDMTERLDAAALWPSKLVQEERKEEQLGLETGSLEMTAERLVTRSFIDQGWPVGAAAKVRNTTAYAVMISELEERQQLQPIQKDARALARDVAKSKMVSRLIDNPLLTGPEIVCPTPAILRKLLGHDGQEIQPGFKASRAGYYSHPNDPIRRTRMIHSMMVGIAKCALGVKPQLTLPKQTYYRM